MKTQKVVGSFLLAFTFLISFTGIAWSAETAMEHFTTKEQCVSCHGKENLSITKDNTKISLYVDVYQYEKSVHGSLFCNACHDFDENHVYNKDLREKVSEKCANCHTGASFQYDRSIHAKTADKNKPNCVDCHGDHGIAKVDSKESSVIGMNLSVTCGKNCHKIQYEQFQESFHGKAVALGAKNAPDCVTCHNSHQILGKDDPKDITNTEKKHLLCGQCHEGNVLGVGTVEHYELKAEGYSKPMYLIKTKLPWLIIITLGVFLLHIILDLFYRLRKRRS